MSFTFEGKNCTKFQHSLTLTLKSTWPTLAISLALLVISLAKAYSRVFMSNCHISTPTFLIDRLVNNNCKTEYHRPNFRT